MITALKGNVQHLTPSVIELDIGGIAYEVHIGPQTYSRLSALETSNCTLFTSLIVRENAHTLFGFLERNEKQTFETLLHVSGIGPKTALCLVDHLGIETLQKALAEEDINTICRVPGIGKKSAQRLIYEAKDKLTNQPTPKKLPHSPNLEDAINALINLGYKPQAAQKAVQKTVSDEEKPMDLPLLITNALKQI